MVAYTGPPPGLNHGTDQLREVNRLPLERLCRFRLNKTPGDVDRALRFVVHSAYTNIPAYRRLLEESETPFGGRDCTAELSRLPIVRREMLLLDTPLADRIHRRADPAKCIQTQTSGSEGIPITVYMAPSEARFRRLLLVRAWGRGVRLRFPLTVIDVGGRLDARERLEVRWHGAIRLVRVPIASLDSKEVGILLRYRHAILSGYPSSLAWLAERLGPKASLLSVAMTATRGEILHDDVRSSLEEAFGRQVVDYYNCEEVGNIAWQCPTYVNKLHVNTDACIIEIVDEAGEVLPRGEEGRVLVTNLYNCTMPFIRYDLQDRGVLLPASGDHCLCGSRNPAVGLVQGRDDDFLLLMDGNRVSPRLMAATLERAVDGLRITGYQETLFRRYQIVQDAPDHVTVRIVPMPNADLPFEMHIAEAFQRIDPGLRCSVVVVDSLPSTTSGKFRKVVRTFDASET